MITEYKKKLDEVFGDNNFLYDTQKNKGIAYTEGGPQNPQVGQETGHSMTETHPMHSMDYNEFDQSAKGWRSLPEKEQSGVINGYIRKNKENLALPHQANLYWHLGQAHALQGNEKEAVRYMRKSKIDDDKHWNNYADATIAFINKDEGLFRHHSAGANFDHQPNRETLDRLGKNFGKSYRDAY
jgi:hypothetical protein